MVALPQEPYFSPGTVRQNLSLQQIQGSILSEAAMLDALDKVGLRQKFETLADASSAAWPGALDVELVPTDMLTKGQQQLFAMARAMLTRGQILVIDEATSG